MNQINEYVMLLVGCCLATGGITLLTPTGNYEKTIRLISSIFLLFCILSPLREFTLEAKDYSSYQEENESAKDSWEYSTQVLEKTVKKKAEECVVTVTGHQPEKVLVRISTNNEEFFVDKLEITLMAQDASKISAVADYTAMTIGVRPAVITS